MKNEMTGKRMSAFSPLQRAIRSTRCKFIDADWIGYCPRCNEPYVLIEECTRGFMLKKIDVTQSLARKAGVPAHLVQGCGVGGKKEGWFLRSIAPDDDGVSEALSREEMEDFVMSSLDAHDCKSTQFPDEGKRWDKMLRCDVWAWTGTHRIWDYKSRKVISAYGVEGTPCPWVEPENMESQELLKQSAGLGTLSVWYEQPD